MYRTNIDVQRTDEVNISFFEYLPRFSILENSHDICHSSTYGLSSARVRITAVQLLVRPNSTFLSESEYEQQFHELSELA